MKIKSYLSRFFVEVPGKHRDEFKREIYHRHIDTILILAVIIFLFEAAASFILMKYSKSVPYSVWIASIMAVYIGIYYKLSRSKPDVITIGYEILENCIIVFILLTGIYISIIDPNMKDVIYIIIILIIAELFCLKPAVSLVIYPCMGLLIVLANAFIFNQDFSRTVNNVINLIFTTVIAIAVSNIAYKNRLKDFLNRKDIEEKTRELIMTQQQLMNSEKMAALG